MFSHRAPFLRSGKLLVAQLDHSDKALECDGFDGGSSMHGACHKDFQGSRSGRC